MRIIKNFYDKFFTKKLNVNASDSARNLTAAVAEAATAYKYSIDTNPSGSFRALNVDPLVEIVTGAPTISQPLYGSNLKVELNGTTGTIKTGGVFAVNAYSLISGAGHTVDKNAGISVLADVGNNLSGTIVNNNFSLEVNGVAARTNTVITNARSVVVNCPNHGTTRRGLLIGAEGTTGLAVGINNVSFENLGTSRFVGKITVLNESSFSALVTAASILVTNAFRLNTSVPTSASDGGNTGSIAVDADYIYVCTSANTWKRAALSTW
jgi:hypothetical protein